MFPYSSGQRSHKFYVERGWVFFCDWGDLGREPIPLSLTWAFRGFCITYMLYKLKLWGGLGCCCKASFCYVGLSSCYGNLVQIVVFLLYAYDEAHSRRVSACTIGARGSSIVRILWWQLRSRNPPRNGGLTGEGKDRITVQVFYCGNYHG